ncbi:uncharacterized protein LOC111700662 [Eurytemora carolleeae]|uniref:uncharacterized protein LOC111700662 n=1 Tax=Eurytemora carolleeae TaxID=1294199 RepID=UPI000C783C4C|nr:uncharacterized protein LOC111700662 [Eurytemora carolleeae]|eukprot:XP_023327415.1 uncharacterized protein LOC111700662 [Eurytemora affinis]
MRVAFSVLLYIQALYCTDANLQDLEDGLIESNTNTTQQHLENLEDARAIAKSNLEKEKEEVGLLQGEILSTDILYSNKLNIFSTWLTANSVCAGQSLNNTDIEHLWIQLKKISDDVTTTSKRRKTLEEKMVAATTSLKEAETRFRLIDNSYADLKNIIRETMVSGSGPIGKDIFLLCGLVTSYILA